MIEFLADLQWYEWYAAGAGLTLFGMLGVLHLIAVENYKYDFSKFVEDPDSKDRCITRRGRRPEFDVLGLRNLDGVFGAYFTIGLVSMLFWPVTWTISIYLGLGRLIQYRIDKKLVKAHKSVMVTSPHTAVREMAQKHLKNEKDKNK